MKITRIRIDVTDSLATLEVWTDEPDKQSLVSTDWVIVSTAFQKVMKALPGKTARAGSWYMTDRPESDAQFVMACEWKAKQ
jgi:hypothetical protein